jgi:hypothetical protein
MAEEVKDRIAFQRQIFYILIGGLIGVAGPSAIAIYQAHEQREQFLMDRRITALKEFAAALNGYSEIIGKLEQMQSAALEVAMLFPNSNSRDALQKLDRLGQRTIFGDASVFGRD